MSDAEGDDTVVPQAATTDPLSNGDAGQTAPITMEDTLRDVLKKALIADGLARGLHEAAKALDFGTPQLCVLAKNCDEPAYIKLVEALCKEKKVQLIRVDDGKKLGEWVGLCKYDTNGNARKVVRCSCAVVTKHGEKDAADKINQFMKDQG